MSNITKALALVVLCAGLMAVPSVRADWIQDGVALCTSMGQQDYPQIVSDGAGGAIVTWYNGDIYAQRVNASGAVPWAGDGVALCTDPWEQKRSRIASDGGGGAIIAWEDFREGNYDAHYDIYAQRVDASGAVQWTVDGVALCTAMGEQTWPEIVSDGAGGAVVAWYDKRSGNYDIYAQRVDAQGTIQWTSDGVALCTTPEYQANPQLVSDGAGGAIVAWTDYRGAQYNIYAQRVDASGAVQWTANGVALSTSPAYQGAQEVASDGAGGAIVAWTDGRNGDPEILLDNLDIYVQRVDASGAVRWTAGGVAICTAAESQMHSRIVSDGAGGAIVTWDDGRDPGNSDIYAQRVNASGSVQWTVDGIAVCATAGAQFNPGIVSDNAGGAIITWQDARVGNNDIYARRVDASGAVQWTADGVSLCTATGEQDYPEIASDGVGGAIVTWRDYRIYNNCDIYAAKVDPNGLTAAYVPSASIELHQNYPNPFNPVTTITYSLSEQCRMSLDIYDVSGRRVACLVKGWRGKGSYAAKWNGTDEHGIPVASGIYFYRLTAGSQTIARKMALLR